ncbi:uncharacterized protein B0T15DRAFT_488203 [Chaetomium strumarium]|uniref:Uncharacterized protein n=1 Tax=Chaetomium strumarium TaxID=1170767 RepID=A0AAJ0H0A8_9PEZI|nr:hypothetical protein B0T15DRAFT_488203 [Chaetomium strumarium]
MNVMNEPAENVTVVEEDKYDLNFASGIPNATVPARPIHAARVSMEARIGEESGEDGPGACQIKLCPFADRSYSAIAGFQFELLRTITLANMMQIIEGTFPDLPAALRCDMKGFDFMDVDGYFDGCRDWIAQAFVRAHAAGVVGWDIPHAVFKLDFVPPFGSSEDIKSALVSIELRIGEDSRKEGPGACQGKLCTDTGRNKRRVSVGFQFMLLRPIILRQMIDLINGEHSMLPSTTGADLKCFDFIDNDRHFDGCRDWIAQAFVRAHAIDVVDWKIAGITGPSGQQLQHVSLRPKPGVKATVIDWNNAGFHDVIGKYFEEPSIDGAGNMVVHYRHLPLEAGRFWARDFSPQLIPEPPLLAVVAPLCLLHMAVLRLMAAVVALFQLRVVGLLPLPDVAVVAKLLLPSEVVFQDAGWAEACVQA